MGVQKSVRAAAIVVFVLFTAAAGGLCAPSEEKTSEASFLFDTVCTITLYGKAPASHFVDVFSRMEEIESRLDLYDEESALSELNRHAGMGPVAVPEELFEVVKHGIAYSRLTGGAFDITIGPVQQLWDIGGDSPEVPDSADLEAALSLVDFRKVIFFEHGKRILLESRGMMIDLGGIAKGYAADQAAKLLRDLGHRRALVNFGGNLVALGTRPDDTPWRIGIQHPDRSRGDTIGIVEVTDATVVTSGKYERFFEQDGTRYHHILDTTTGYPVENGVASVTIITGSSMKADALSTAVFTLGLEAGLELVNGFDGVEAVIVTENDEIYLSKGIGDDFSLVDTRFKVIR